jgi:hypothetical protein
MSKKNLGSNENQYFVVNKIKTFASSSKIFYNQDYQRYPEHIGMFNINNKYLIYIDDRKNHKKIDISAVYEFFEQIIFCGFSSKLINLKAFMIFIK